MTQVSHGVANAPTDERSLHIERRDPGSGNVPIDNPCALPAQFFATNRRAQGHCFWSCADVVCLHHPSPDHVNAPWAMST
jgi:hypothetical protein